MRICVFCSSSSALDEIFYEEARALGREMAARGHCLVYGGGDIGTMGVLAHALQDGGGKVVGVIPHALNSVDGIGFPGADELIVTETMRQRKAVMEENSDAFIALPGGLGTFEELLEIITLKQLHYHPKPIVVLNATGYFDHLLAMLEYAVRGRFMKEETLGLFRVCDSITDALDYIEQYTPEESPMKWYVDIPFDETTPEALE